MDNKNLIIWLDERANAVSNLNKSREDNNYGRAAQAIEDLETEVKRLTDMCIELQLNKFVAKAADHGVEVKIEKETK